MFEYQVTFPPRFVLPCLLLPQIVLISGECQKLMQKAARWSCVVCSRGVDSVLVVRSQYQQKHSRTHTYADDQSSLICFLHLLRSIASSLFSLRAWQSFCTTSVQVQVLWSTSRSGTLHFIHFFTQPLSFCNICKDNLFLKTHFIIICYYTLHSFNGLFSRTTWVSRHQKTHTHNRFTAGLEYVRVHPGQQVPER